MAIKSSRSGGRSRQLKEVQIALAGTNNPEGTLAYDLQKLTERPTEIKALFKRLRTMSDESAFLSAFLPLKLSFYNSGFAITPGPLGKGGQKEIDAWLSKDYTTEAVYKDPGNQGELEVEYNMTIGDAINRFVRDAWREFLLLDTVVSMWMDDGSAPTTLAPELCRYQDKLGVPVLYYTHGISGRDLDLLSKEQQTRFRTNTELMLNPKEGEHYKVLTRGLVGSGFVKPRLYSVLRTLGEIESKEIGYHGRAHQLRAATRQHKIGHEITNGYHAGKGTWFCNKKRADAALAAMKNRQGPHDLATNFDHEIIFSWPDVALFDATAWKGTNMRLCNWGGPIAQMLLAEKVIEGGLAFERAMATGDRTIMAEYLTPIIKAAFKAPDGLDIKVMWSDLCFIDPARAAELLKFAVQQGICSVTTTQQIIGFNPETEAALKVKEASDPEAEKKYRPLWDTSHALAPAQGQTAADLKADASGKSGSDATTANGRPAGTGNK
jgi:hypothetical protein